MENGTRNDKMMDLQWYERAAVLRNTFDNNAHITAGACSGVISFDKFWFFLLLSRLLTRSWQVSGQTLVEGIWLVAVSQSRWFLNCNHSRVITIIIIAIAVSQTRLRYNVDNVDGRQWLPMSCTSLGQVFDRCLPGTCQVLARYLAKLTCTSATTRLIGQEPRLSKSWQNPNLSDRKDYRLSCNSWCHW